MSLINTVIEEVKKEMPEIKVNCNKTTGISHRICREYFSPLKGMRISKKTDETKRGTNPIKEEAIGKTSVLNTIFFTIEELLTTELHPLIVPSDMPNQGASPLISQIT